MHTPHDQPVGALAGEVVTPAQLTADQRAAMFALLSHYFANVTRTHFEQDLAEKEWVVLLCDRTTRAVKGFSTLMQLRLTVDGAPIVAFFSGDTIIDQAYWGEAELPRIWSRHVFGQADAIQAAGGGERVYWFLISSGYKTYRFLTVFFCEFFPTHRRPTPAPIQRILDALGQAKFPGDYDPATGIVRFAAAAPLREGVADVTPRRLKDPHVAFFVARNPGYATGDQLACLVEICRANVTPAGVRVLAAIA